MINLTVKTFFYKRQHIYFGFLIGIKINFRHNCLQGDRTFKEMEDHKHIGSAYDISIKMIVKKCINLLLSLI